jgi:hypothetical protein
MIVEVFVAQHQTINPLAQKFLFAVLDIARVPIIDETVLQIPQQTAMALQFS